MQSCVTSRCIKLLPILVHVTIILFTGDNKSVAFYRLSSNYYIIISQPKLHNSDKSYKILAPFKNN